MIAWEDFFRQKLRLLLTEKKSVVDIGGGLRVNPKQGNRYDPSRRWLVPLVAAVDYKILDPVPDYQPDIVGDIHDLPFADNSQEAILCLAVLEHVKNPQLACQEIYRVLKPGGYCFAYVPFLFYYHAEPGYYQDYWRFSEDAVKLLFSQFIKIEIQSVRGAIETWLKISPLGRFSLFISLARLLDRALGKQSSRQVSGYYIFAVK